MEFRVTRVQADVPIFWFPDCRLTYPVFFLTPAQVQADTPGASGDLARPTPQLL